MRIADTSALYALFDETDAHHDAAWEAVEDPEPVLIPTEILVEWEGLVRLRMGPNRAAAALEDLLGLHHTRTPGENHLTAALAAYRDHPALSLADAVVVAQCILHDAQPITFDGALQDALP